jgi:hypothetical protein
LRTIRTDKQADSSLDQQPAGPRWRPRLLPRFMSINDWTDYSGLGRTRTYEAIKRGDIETLLVGGRRLIDVQSGLSYLETKRVPAKT